VILKLDTDPPETAVRVARLFAYEFPRKDRGVGVRRCVVYSNGVTTHAAYWTRTMLVVRQLEREDDSG